MAKRETYSANFVAAEITATKEILNMQQQLLNKLYTELDQEREASKTAAIETLSMILRLQLEKADIELGAKQYKRMFEEKFSHVNECFKTLEDVIHRKDIQIALLQCRIQNLKFQILSLNYRNCGESENEIGECSDTEEIGNSYWQQIKKLDEIVKQISNRKEFERRKEHIFIEKQSENLHETNVQDIFEVSEPRIEMKRLYKRIERLELEYSKNGVNSRQEITTVVVQELKLLKELLNKIQTELSIVETDIKSLKITKFKKRDDLRLRILQKEMMHFWI